MAGLLPLPPVAVTPAKAPNPGAHTWPTIISTRRQIRISKISLKLQTLFRAASGRQIIGTAIFQVRVHRPLRMIGCIFAALYGCRLKGLVGLCKFLDGFVGSIFNIRELLHIARLPGAV